MCRTGDWNKRRPLTGIVLGPSVLRGDVRDLVIFGIERSDQLLRLRLNVRCGLADLAWVFEWCEDSQSMTLWILEYSTTSAYYHAITCRWRLRKNFNDMP